MFCIVVDMPSGEPAIRAAYTVGEVADMYSVSASHIRRLLREGVLRRVPFMGSSVRISPDELERVFGSLPGGAA